MEGTGYGFEGDWNGVDNSAFNAGYYATGADEIVRDTPIHSVGIDLGFASVGISYDPGTGLRSIDASYDGFYVQQSENGHGGLETYLGVHYGPFTAAGSVDHWREGYGQISYGGFNVGVSSDAEGHLGASAGVSADLGYGGVGVSAGYGVNVDAWGYVTSGMNYSVGYSEDLKNPNFNTMTLSGPGYAVADTGGRWAGSFLGGAYHDFDPRYAWAYAAAQAAHQKAVYATAAVVGGASVGMMAAGVAGMFFGGLIPALPTLIGPVTSAAVGAVYGSSDTSTTLNADAAQSNAPPTLMTPPTTQPTGHYISFDPNYSPSAPSGPNAFTFDLSGNSTSRSPYVQPGYWSGEQGIGRYKMVSFATPNPDGTVQVTMMLMDSGPGYETGVGSVSVTVDPDVTSPDKIRNNMLDVVNGLSDSVSQEQAYQAMKTTSIGVVATVATAGLAGRRSLD